MKISELSLDPCKERTDSDTEKPTGTIEAHKQQSEVKQEMLCAREALDRGKQKQTSKRLDHLMQEPWLLESSR